jgi:excisionase family DNA binding protein
MLSVNERMLKIATANPAVLARVDAILCGDATAQKPEADVRLVTYTEAAKRMGVSRPTVYRLAKAGRLEIVPLNGVNRIRLQSVVDCVSKVAK